MHSGSNPNERENNSLMMSCGLKRTSLTIDLHTDGAWSSLIARFTFLSSGFSAWLIIIDSQQLSVNRICNFNECQLSLLNCNFCAFLVHKHCVRFHLSFSAALGHVTVIAGYICVIYNWSRSAFMLRRCKSYRKRSMQSARFMLIQRN